MRIVFLLMMGTFLYSPGFSQSVGIGTSSPHQSAMLDVSSSGKGILFPRVTDTSAVANPAKGLTVFSLANNKLWLYTGANWQALGVSTSDQVWTRVSDSAAYTNKKFIGINTDFSVMSNQANLQVVGNMIVQEPVILPKNAATQAQTITMTNSDAEINLGGDSIFRVFDPGGANANYSTNQRGTVLALLRDKSDQTGWSIKFNPTDFGLADGDSLWISTVGYPQCRENFEASYTATASSPGDMILSTGTYLYVVFRSDAAINSKGFDVTIRRIFSAVDESKVPPVNNSGNAFYFSRGSLGAGFNANAVAPHSIALGMNTIATHQGAVSIGLGSEAREMNATAIGHKNKALGGSSIAIGGSNMVRGAGSIALGSGSQTLEYGSVAIGSGIIVKAPMTYGIGHYNDTSDRAFTVKTPGDRLFQIGNGESNARSNAITVLRNGNVGIGHNSPEAGLHFKNVLGNRRLVLWQTVPNNDFEYFGFGINDYTLRYNAAAGSSHSFYCTNVQVFTINNQGNALLRGALSQNSDARLKTNILPLKNALSQITRLNGYRYHWKDPSRGHQEQLGLLAQEVQLLYPQLVSEDEQGTLSVNYNGLTPVLIEAIKELNEKVSQLEKELSLIRKNKTKEKLISVTNTQ